MAWDTAQFIDLIFGVDGAPANNQWITPGCSAISANEIRQTIPYACRLVRVDVMTQAAPGGGFTDTYTVHLNGAPTAAVVNIADPAQLDNWAGAAVAYAAGSEISIQFTTTGATSAVDIAVLLRFQVVK